MFNTTEYYTVILAGLLHDIGKLLNRTKDVIIKHPKFSAKFIEEEGLKDIIKPEWVDYELLKTLCQRHHESQNYPDDLKVQTIEDHHVKALAYIVSRADNYSSKERKSEKDFSNDKEKAEYYKNARLCTIFSQIDIGKGTIDPDNYKYYDLAPLDYNNVFPKSKNELNLQKYSYDKLITKDFASELRNLKPDNFTHLYNGLLSIFEKYLWAVPADTTVKIPDISLYDHLSTTSAIAACLYQYHCNEFNENSIKNDSEKKFILIAGDLSGIQKFIFEINSTNPKKINKVLRGRSFYLSLLVEAVSILILHELNLPISCRIMNAGGQFTILAPNTNQVREKIKEIERKVNKYFLNTFLGKLALNLSYNITLSGDELDVEKLPKVLENLKKDLERIKQHKFNNILNETDIFNNFESVYNKLKSRNGPCELCGIYPKLKDNTRCDICITTEKIGNKLISSNYISFTLERTEDTLCYISDIYINFEKQFNPNALLVMKIREEEDREKNKGYTSRYIANYLPVGNEQDINFTNESPQDNTLCAYCKDKCKISSTTLDELKRENLKHSILTFQCIGTESIRYNKGKSVDHLAILKADVDNLGLIFSIGLKDRDKDLDKLTFSRYAALSRQLSYFFGQGIKTLIKQKFKYIYTVYSGGDDLLLIGPWEQIIEFVIELNKEFKRYVGYNPNITFSAGITLMRPNYPVGLGVKDAEHNLELSKNGNKNSLTVFNTTVEFGEGLNKLIEFKNVLVNEFNNPQTKLTTSFLYRLLEYHKMFLETLKGKYKYLRFHSLMAKDVKLNIEKRKEDKVLNQDFIDKLLPLYQIKEHDQFLMKNLKIPLFWTLYKFR